MFGRSEHLLPCAHLDEFAAQQHTNTMAERKKRYTPQGTIKGVTGKHYG